MSGRTPAGASILLLLSAVTAAEGSASDRAVHRRAWLLMGTTFEASLVASDSAVAQRGFEAAYGAVVRVDSLMSLYKEDSEVCRINRWGAIAPVAVASWTYDVIEAALRFSELTDGAFDITVKPSMDAWGFYRRRQVAPASEEVDSLLQITGWRKVSLEPSSSSVGMSRRGMAIDLGGIAKGYALDRAKDALARAEVRNALINLGGNILALGTPPEDPEGWPVGVRDPLEPDSLITVLKLKDRAIASSGDYEKFVVLDGTRYGHIIDPRTARPVQGTAGTAVVAPDAVTADALSTAAFVLGPDEAFKAAGRWGDVDLLLATRIKAGAGEYHGTGVFAPFDSRRARSGASAIQEAREEPH
jgi:thiamine biosynthesis lipoprotein